MPASVATLFILLAIGDAAEVNGSDVQPLTINASSDVSVTLEQVEEKIIDDDALSASTEASVAENTSETQIAMRPLSVVSGGFLATRLYDANAGLCASCCSGGQGCEQLQPSACCAYFPACTPNGCPPAAAQPAVQYAGPAAPVTQVPATYSEPYSEEKSSGGIGFVMVIVFLLLACACMAAACCCLRQLCGCLCPCMTDNPNMHGDGYGGGSMVAAALAGGLGGYEMGQMSDGGYGGYGGYGGGYGGW